MKVVCTSYVLAPTQTCGGKYEARGQTWSSKRVNKKVGK